MFAQGEAIMGPLFAILYACLCLVVFGMMDLLTIRRADGSADLSTLAMITLWVYFYRGITAEAFSNVVVFIFRDFAQKLVIYSTVFGIARFFLGDRPVRAESSPLTGLQRAT
jgi:ribose/xylose/arabinose/galactoside ABC-type transport system permease subunit